MVSFTCVVLACSSVGIVYLLGLRLLACFHLLVSFVAVSVRDVFGIFAFLNRDSVGHRCGYVLLFLTGIQWDTDVDMYCFS